MIEHMQNTDGTWVEGRQNIAEMHWWEMTITSDWTWPERLMEQRRNCRRTIAGMFPTEHTHNYRWNIPITLEHNRNRRWNVDGRLTECRQNRRRDGFCFMRSVYASSPSSYGSVYCTVCSIYCSFSVSGSDYGPSPTQNRIKSNSFPFSCSQYL